MANAEESLQPPPERPLPWAQSAAVLTSEASWAETPCKTRASAELKGALEARTSEMRHFFKKVMGDQHFPQPLQFSRIKG